MKTKLERFAAINTYRNVIQVGFEQLQGGHGMPLKGKWGENFFNNNQPLVLELGCGKGEYTVGLSRNYPDKNFIGVDIKGNRIYIGATTCLEEGISNAGFLRTRIDFIDACFGENEVSEIWITFPDPQPQKPRERKRLTAPLFLNRYAKCLKPGGIIHLKTDSRPLWEYTLEVIANEGHTLLSSTDDLYLNTPAELLEAASIKTYYEDLFTKKGFKINYLRFQLKAKV